MKKTIWMKIKKTNNINIDVLKVNDFFLTGTSVINQAEDKEIGDEIVYYKVININKNNIEYIPIYDILEE